MKIEILFTTLGKLIIEADAAYTSGQALCVQLPDGMIRHFPLIHVWSWTCLHSPHWGTTQTQKKTDE